MKETPQARPPGQSQARPAGPILRLLHQGGLYTLSNLAVKVAGLVLLVFFLDPALLSQADYGRLQLLEVTAQVLIAVGGLGLAHGLLKFLHDEAFAAEREALPFTTLIGTLALAGVLFGLLWGLARPLAAFLVDDPEAVAPVRLAGAYVALKLVGLVPFTVLRAGERAGRYALAAVGEAVLLAVAVAYFLAVRDAGLVGVMGGFVVSAAGSTLLLTALMLRRTPLRVERRLLGPLFRFGAPMAAAALASLVLNAGDRLVLKAFTDAEVVAVYGLAAKYGGLVNMLFVQSFQLAFTVIGLKALAPGGEGADVHRRTFRHFVVVTGWGVLGVSLLARDVTAALSPNPAFLAAEPLVLPIALGFMAYGVYFIGMNVLYAAGRARAIAAGVGAAAAANLLLNVAAIPLLGAMGAALTSLVAYAGLAAVTLRAGRSTPVAYRWDALAAVLLLLLGLWVIAQPSAAWGTGARLAFRGALLAAYPAAVLAAGLYGRDEVRSMWETARQTLRRGAS